MNAYISGGTGAPEGVVTAKQGSLWLRRDGGSTTTVYWKASGSGNTGWVSVGSIGLVGVDFLVGTATAELSSEIVAGTAPGGELGGSWGSPTVDTTHSGSSHADAVATAEGYADSAVATHAGASDPHTGYLKESNTIDFLVGTASAELGGEIVVGTTPGGELGNTWASPTVDASHSGSTHAATQAAAEATAAAADAAHVAASDPHTGYLREATTVDFLVGTATAELAGEIVVGASPGGELGGTWASPTVDATHSGSAHHAESHASRHADGGADEVVDSSQSPSTQAFSDAANAGADTTKASPVLHKHAMPADPTNAAWLFPLFFSRSGVLATGVGAFRVYNDSGKTLTIHKIRASVGTVPVGASILVDVNIDGTTIWATQGNRVAVVASANTGTQTSFDTTTIADGHYFTIDIDQIGSTTPGSDLVLQIWCHVS